MSCASRYGTVGCSDDRREGLFRTWSFCSLWVACQRLSLAHVAFMMMPALRRLRSVALCACMQMSIKRTEKLETGDDGQFVGADADLIFAPALIFAVSEGVQVSLNQQNCSVTSQGVATFNAGMNTEVRSSTRGGSS